MKNFLTRTFLSLSLLAILVSGFSFSTRPIFNSFTDSSLINKSVTDATYKKTLRLLSDGLKKEVLTNNSITNVQPLVGPIISGCSSNISVSAGLDSCSRVVYFPIPTAASAGGSLSSTTIYYSNKTIDSFTVPIGVTSITIAAAGAPGGVKGLEH